MTEFWEVCLDVPLLVLKDMFSLFLSNGPHRTLLSQLALTSFRYESLTSPHKDMFSLFLSNGPHRVFLSQLALTSFRYESLSSPQKVA